MKILKDYCKLAFFIFFSAPLEAKSSIYSGIAGIGPFYREGHLGEKISLGVQFDGGSSLLEYQHNVKGERLAWIIDKGFRLNEEVSLIGSVGSTIWLGDKEGKDVIFEPLIGVGLRYDWSPYVAASISYQYVLSNDSRELLEPSIELGLVFRPFYQHSTETKLTKIPGQALQKPMKANRKNETQGCKMGLFLRSIYFAHGNANADIKIEDIVQLQLDSTSNLNLIGHTDATGDNEYNQRLGLKRAEYVKKTLVGYGAKGSSIRTCSQGEEGANRQKRVLEDWIFRRVDIYLDESSFYE